MYSELKENLKFFGECLLITTGIFLLCGCFSVIAFLFDNDFYISGVVFAFFLLVGCFYSSQVDWSYYREMY